ncbi:MAG: hypothetical protein IJZ79_04665 [Bacilli bacterium]|nr:hypothetical protein [Bacilli bacterium]
MKNENLPLFDKGTFLPIDNQFMIEGHEVLQRVQEVQEKFHKEDTDTFINELRDSIAGYTLGFKLVNVSKHGFDCKLSQSDRCYLEVKSASFIADSWQATFNDTTLEKAEAFKDEKVYLALAVWKDASDLLFICYGQNPKIGQYLERKVRWFKEGHTVRSTQSISLSKLVFEYGFKILAVNKSRDEVLSLLRLKNRAFINMSDDTVITLKDFKNIQNKRELEEVI